MADSQKPSLDDDRAKLDVKTQAQLLKEVGETIAAYERLKASGQLTGEELARAALKAEESIRKLTAEADGSADSISAKMKTVFSGWTDAIAKVKGAFSGLFGAGKDIAAMLGPAMDFESAMSAVQVAASASGEELNTLREAAEQAGASTKFSSIEAAGALESLAKGGFSAGDAVKALPAVLDLAAASGVGLGEASDYISKAVAGMGLSFADAGRVADVLVTGANASNASVNGLADALSKVAPTASSLGLSLEQTVAMIGKFADAGIDASSAGTALSSIMAQFSDPTSKFRSELAAMRITTNNFDDALNQLASAGERGRRAINAVGQDAGPKLSAMLRQGMGSLDELKNKLDQSSGSARSFAAIASDNLEGAAKGFGNAWDAFLIKLGSPSLDTLKNQISAVAERLREFVSDGTAERFGDVIKSAFEAAGKWAAELSGKIDFTSLTEGMQSFAGRATEFFDGIGEKVATAGNVAQTAYGVMSAGVNTVLAGVYKLGQGMSWLTSALLADLASISQGIAKITFGDVSKGFAATAEKMRFEARAAYAVYEEFGRKSSAAFDDANNGARLAQEGFAGLADTAKHKTTAAFGAVETQAKSTAERIAELRAEQQRLTEAGDIEGATKVWREITRLSAEAGNAAKTSLTTQRIEAEATKATLSELRAAYAQAINAGDTQKAAEIQQQIRIELGLTGKQAKVTAGEFGAAMNGLSAEADGAGKAVASSMQEAADATKGVGDSASETADNISLIGSASDEAAKAVDESSKAIEEASEYQSVTVERAWLRGKAAASSYASEAIKSVWEAYQAGKLHISQLDGAANKYVEAMERIDSRQASIGTSSTARDIDELKIRLLELNGTEEQVAEARRARDVAAVRSQIALLELDRDRAQVRGDRDETARLQREISLSNEKISLIDQIYDTEKKKRAEAEAEAKRKAADDAKAKAKEKAEAEAAEAKKAKDAGTNARTSIKGVYDSGASISEGAAERTSAEAAERMRAMTSVVNITLQPGVDLSNRAQAEQIARTLMPAIQNLTRRGA